MQDLRDPNATVPRLPPAKGPSGAVASATLRAASPCGPVSPARPAAQPLEAAAAAAAAACSLAATGGAGVGAGAAAAAGGGTDWASVAWGAPAQAIWSEADMGRWQASATHAELVR